MKSRSRWLDWRVWFGLLVTAFFVWLALRDAPLREVARTIARANWWVLWSVSIPAYLLVLYVRARRWRHFTDPIQPMTTGSLFRAASVGFMVNNIFPLRLGEFARTGYLARETGASAAAIFGTVILERVVDAVSVIAIFFGVFAVWGVATDGVFAQRALLLLPVAILPIFVLGWLRARPDTVIGLVSWLLRPFPDRMSEMAERILSRFSEGLGALRGGMHLFWIALDSVVIWVVLSTLPLIAAMAALGVDLGSPRETLHAAWMTLAFVGVAVAMPSAPGFFGPYHYAARLALERFGVPPETALAVGTLAHAVMWVCLTTTGLVVLRLRRTSLHEVEVATGGPPGADSR